MSRVGVLAVQGAFLEHEAVLEDLGAECFEIRRLADMDESPDALVLPGGESTVMGKLMRDLGLLGPMRDAVLSGIPVLGTCAGMILLAEDVEGESPHLGTMPIRVRRNAYGRQLGSFTSEGRFVDRTIPLEFIRAPMIVSADPEVVVLCRCGGLPVAVRYGNQLATAFHPELTGDRTVHSLLLSMVGD